MKLEDIKKIRTELGLTQQGLADVLKAHRSSVLHWEIGHSKISTINQQYLMILLAIKRCGFTKNIDAAMLKITAEFG